MTCLIGTLAPPTWGKDAAVPDMLQALRQLSQGFLLASPRKVRR